MDRERRARIQSADEDRLRDDIVGRRQNVIQRAVIRSVGTQLEVSIPPIDDRTIGKHAQPTTLEQVERAHILATLKATGWVLAGPRGAALRLGLNRNTLQFRMKKLGIVRQTAN